jgi:hypothetical protein
MFITETDGNYLKRPRGLNYLGTGGDYRYWLPSLLKHEYVALRFVTQAASSVRKGGADAHLAHA